MSILNILLVIFILSDISFLFTYNLTRNEKIAENKIIFSRKVEKPPDNPPPSVIPTHYFPTQSPETDKHLNYYASPSTKNSSTPQPSFYQEKPEIVTYIPSPEATQKLTITPESLLIALNNYRINKSIPPLKWDNKLAEVAQKRVEEFVSLGDLDQHRGFGNFIDSGGMQIVGFSGLGENSGGGGLESPINLIENYYGNHQPHNENQLNTVWTHVGIGVLQNYTDFIFGTR